MWTTLKLYLKGVSVAQYPPKIVVRALLRARYLCECCGKPVYWEVGRDRPLAEIHSCTTLHLTERIDRPGYYQSTSPTENHAILKNRYLFGGNFIFPEYRRSDDAFCLCLECHDLIHSLAKHDLDGKNAIPAELEKLTLVMCGYI